MVMVTGNIAGVATAVAAGGPGAVFWMWVTAAFGGATKFAEAVLAVRYRITNEKGEMSGGPMYFIKIGMKDRYGGNWAWLGWAFAFFGFVASFGIGNMVQSNSVAAAMNQSVGIPPYVSGIIIAIATALVIIGGIKSIAKVTSKIVPLMAVFYIAGCLVVLIAKIDLVPQAFGLIFSNAFNGTAVGGGGGGFVGGMGTGVLVGGTAVGIGVSVGAGVSVAGTGVLRLVDQAVRRQRSVNAGPAHPVVHRFPAGFRADELDTGATGDNEVFRRLRAVTSLVEPVDVHVGRELALDLARLRIAAPSKSRRQLHELLHRPPGTGHAP